MLSRIPWLAVALAIGIANAGTARSESTAAPSAEDVQASLLAVGDVGWPTALPWLQSGQRSVARGLVAEDERLPVDALVLLGDLFYPHGLVRAELLQRVRNHVAGPYCRFIDPMGSRVNELADACDLPAEDRHVIPIHAIPGNHDHQTPGSPELLRRAVPELVRNWHVPDATVINVELAAGLSLILIDTPALVASGDFEAVHAALRRARGPWRIVAAHLPVAPGDPKADAEWRAGEMPLAHFSLPEAPVHLFLAGHRHNLQVIEGVAPGPLLHVIAGSGANIRPVRMRYARRLLALERAGFVRVDLVGSEARQRLVVSVFSMPRYPIAFWAKPTLEARWSLEHSGALHAEYLRVP